jgi:hypothetical protein
MRTSGAHQCDTCVQASSCWNVLLSVSLTVQVLGAVADALGTAYNAVRPEVQSAALPVKVCGCCVAQMGAQPGTHTVSNC